MSTRPSNRWLFASLLLIGAYALPPFAPPGPTPLFPPTPDAPLLERLFPGVPGWWIVGRLTCLLVAAAIVGAVTKRGFAGLSQVRARADTWSDVRRPFLTIGLVLAALQVAASFWSASFGRVAQLGYMCWFALPALALTRGSRRSAGKHILNGRVGAAVAAVLAAWLLMLGLVAWNSPRSLDCTDCTDGFHWLNLAAAPTFNFLTDHIRAGESAMHIVFQGGRLFSGGGEPSWEWLQLVRLFWLVVTAVGAASIAARAIGRMAAPVAAAAFLFSPLIQSLVLTTLPNFYLGPPYAAVLIWLALIIYQDRSSWAVAALGATAGIAVTLPVAAPVAAVVCGCVGWSLMKRPRPRATVLAISALSFLAAAIPGLSGAGAPGLIIRNYAVSRTQWAAVEAVFLGQVAPHFGEGAMFSAHPGRFDIVVSGLLAPFASPRTAIRLWGDTFLDPLGGGLVALGIAVCLRSGLRQPGSHALLLLAVVSLLPACVSTYDRPSLLRISGATVPFALLTAVGFEGIRSHLRGRSASVVAMLVATAGIIVGGSVVFNIVNPQILARSSLGIAATALQGLRSSSPAVMLAPAEGWDPQHSWIFVKHFPGLPLVLSPYPLPAAFPPDLAPPFLVWSPGSEDEAGISHGVCERWPGAALYTLADKPGLSRAFAARPAGPGWKPAGVGAWTETDCGHTLDTEGSRAAAALRRARALLEQGSREEALTVLRPAARQAFVQVELFETLARALLADPANRAELREAVYWATRACEVTKFQSPATQAVLAAAQHALDTP